MRLALQEHEIFKDLAQTSSGPGSRIFLFGSRTDDQKGGDMGIYVIPASCNRLFENKIKPLLQTHLRMGEQKIHIILPRDSKCPIEQEAIAKGIEL